MVLVQCVIKAGAVVQNDIDYIVPISGKCSIRVLGIQVWDTDNNNHCDILRLESDVLFFPYSPQRYLTFLSHHTNAPTIDSGLKEYNIYAVIPGKIHLKLVDTATGAVPDHNVYCVLSLEVEQLNRDFDLE